MPLNVEHIRKDFPLLCQKTPPIYFDNACMTLKPRQVLDAMNLYYNEYPVCEGRSAHLMAQKIEQDIVGSRRTMKEFIGANHVNEIVFTRNTTESLNMVASGINWKPGDVVLVSDKEHNSNFMPWQRLNDFGVKLLVVRGTDDGLFSLDAWKKAITELKPRLISFYLTSNLDGETSPAAEVCQIARQNNTLVCLDAAQGAAHIPLNVKEIDCDFMSVSVHKMCGPTGTGILYGKLEELKKLRPIITGGGTVFNVTYDQVKLLEPPRKFEAGLQNYAGLLGIKHAVDYLKNVGLENIHNHEVELNTYLQELISKIPDVKIIGPKNAKDRGGITSMIVDGCNVHDLAIILDEKCNVMLRAGFHCVHGWFNAHGIEGTLRVSTYLYNTKEEIEIFVKALEEAIKE